jgi:hypothetical protein
MSDLVFLDTEIMSWFWTFVVLATLFTLYLCSLKFKKLSPIVNGLTVSVLACWLAFYVYAFFNFYPDQKHFDEVVQKNLFSILNEELEKNKPLKLDFGTSIITETDFKNFISRYNMKYSAHLYNQIAPIEKNEVSKVPLESRFNLAIEKLFERQWYKYYLEFEFEHKLIWIGTKRMELHMIDVSEHREEENLK